MARTNRLNIVRLSITLRDVEPKVTRRMDVPVNTTLGELHYYIQDAMGWYNCHLWQFEARRYGHNIIFSEDSDDDDFGYSYESSAKFTILELIDLLQGKSEFNYLYDFGDSWDHKIRIGKIQRAREDRKYPYLVSGRGRCPLEDIGGAWGYLGFLAAFDDPNSEYREYYPQYFDGDESWEWDPEDAQLDTSRASLARHHST